MRGSVRLVLSCHPPTLLGDLYLQAHHHPRRRQFIELTLKLVELLVRKEKREQLQPPIMLHPRIVAARESSPDEAKPPAS